MYACTYTYVYMYSNLKIMHVAMHIIMYNVMRLDIAN